jgi:hypothetical protein
MSLTAHRVIQVVVLGFCGLVVMGLGFFHREMLENNVTRTATFTLYKNLPPPPRGPAFCPLVSLGNYGVSAPCDFQPPFIWWLRHRQD